MSVKGSLKLINLEEYAIAAEIIRLFFGLCEFNEEELSFPLNEEQKLKASAGLSILIKSNLFVAGKSLNELRFKQQFEEDELEDKIEIEISLVANRNFSQIFISNLVDLRRNLKREIYLLLSAWTSLKFPWGSLTGIRPTLFYERFVRGAGEEKELQILVDDWGLSEDKARLTLEVSEREETIISSFSSDKDYIVYIGLPFCPTRCSYCSFTSKDANNYRDLEKEYVEAVIAEARGFFSSVKRKAAAIYFGGGTPTCLNADLFSFYLESLLALIPHDQETEMTMEAGRPDTLDEEKIRIISQAGFNRLCINPQTMHDFSLQAIGRNHTVKDTLMAYEMARELGGFIINMDLILGLPGETKDQFLSSLQQVIELAPENITLHSLALKQSAKLREETDIISSLESFLPEPYLEEELALSHLLLKDKGYYPYYLYKQKRSRGGLENTGFSFSGCESAYNVLMMSDKFNVVGLGSGASSKFLADQGAVVRQHNSRDVKDYLGRVLEYVAKKKELGKELFTG